MAKLAVIFNVDFPDTLEKLTHKEVGLLSQHLDIEMVGTNHIDTYFEQIVSGEMFSYS